MSIARGGMRALRMRLSEARLGTSTAQMRMSDLRARMSDTRTNASILRTLMRTLPRNTRSAKFAKNDLILSPKLVISPKNEHVSKKN